jgi:hypothetical protein
MTGIYKVTSPTGKVYIGQSWDIKSRWFTYRGLHCKDQSIIYRSLSKYGADKHTFQVIHELPKDVSQEVLDVYETLYWEQYKQTVSMMNAKGPGKGGKHSEETKQKMSEGAKGRVSPTKGKKLKEEDIRKRVETKRRSGYRHSEESNRRRSETQKGRASPLRGRPGPKHSEESKQKMRERKLGKKRGPYKKKINDFA